MDDETLVDDGDERRPDLPMHPDLIDPTPLPAEVAMDEPPVSPAVLELVMAPATTPELRERQDEAVDAAVEAVTRWEITDESAAEWAGGRFTEMTDAVADVDREHTQYLRRLTLWREMRVAPLERFKALLEAKLIAYGQRRREETEEKVKTVALPSATISSRGGQDKWEITDEDALIAYLWALRDADRIEPEQYDAAVKAKLSVLKKGLADVLKVDANGLVYDEETGEKVAGVEFVKGTPTYKVTPR